jgi:hypothetical protein
MIDFNIVYAILLGLSKIVCNQGSGLDCLIYDLFIGSGMFNNTIGTSKYDLQIESLCIEPYKLWILKSYNSIFIF